MLSNLPHGLTPDVDAWNVPTLRARPADKANRELTARLLAAFDKAMDQGGSAGDGLWQSMRELFHGPVIEILENRDLDRLADILAGMFFSPIATGICYRVPDPAEAANDPKVRLLTVDAVLSLGMALGVIRVPNPASPIPEHLFEHDFEQLLGGIAQTLDWDILPPQAGGIAGIPFREGVIPLKYFYQIYAAHRMWTINGGAIDSCLEIGGGVGFLAYMCAANGIVRDYTIIDLPIVNMLQGYLLLNSSMADDVELFGESTGTTGNSRRIRVLPDFAVGELEDKSIDFAFNQDSFTEMGQGTMERYFRQIGRVVRGPLLSINHESEQRVANGFRHGLVHSTLSGYREFKQVYRMPYWLRPGYIEELFLIS